MKYRIQFVGRQMRFAGVLLLSLSTAAAQSLINVKVAGGSPGTPAGAAVIGSSGDMWNYFPNLSGRALGGGVVTNATTIKDSTGTTLNGVTLTASFGGGTGVGSFTDSNGFSPNPPLIMANYTYENAGTSYWSFAFSGLPANKSYMLYGMGNGNLSGQGTTWWVDVTNGHATASATANFANGSRDATLASNAGICWIRLLATTTSSGALTFRVVRLNAAENGTGGSGREYLNAFQLQPLSAPVTMGLTNQTVVAGTTATLNPTTTGVPVPTFQWRTNGVNISGATNASLSLPNVQYSQNGFIYSLVASNLIGMVTNSMALTVIVTPHIDGLNNQSATTGDTVTIAPIVSGVPTPTLRWRFNGTDLSDGATGNGSTIAGSKSSALIITNARAEDSGAYSLITSNSAGVVTNSMTLTVASGNVPPGITGPTDQTVVQTNNATFTASVTGLPVPSLRWRVNGADILGATNTSLTISNVQYSQNGLVYSLVASNSVGQATNSALLFVLVPPVISQQPTNLVVAVNSPATFSVGASGIPAVSYQWHKNGSPIANATSASYTIAGSQGVDNTTVYFVVVSNSVGVVASSNATLTVLSPMSATLVPASGSTNISTDQQLRMVFSSTPHLSAAGKLFVYDASNNANVATIDVSQFVTFSLFSAVVSNAAVRIVQGSGYYYMPIAIYGNEVWITLNPTQQLAYNKTYYVNMDAGLFLDSSNMAFPAITDTNTWRFSTKTSGPAAPTASTGLTNITVGLDGTGDFATLQGASDWIPQNNTLKRNITVQPGIYRDFAVFKQNRNYVTIQGNGSNRLATQFIYPYPANSGVNDSGAGGLRLESSDINVRNLTFDNSVYLTNNGVVFAGPINVVVTTGNRLQFDNVLIKGGQDTLYTSGGIAYFSKCEIWGSTDFIYGSALSVFDQCNIVEIRSTGGPVNAPSTDLAAPYGLVYLNCAFPQASIANGYPYDVGNANTTLMRPWRQDGFTALINCAIGSQLSTKGWSEWDGRENTCRAREYGTTLISGGSVTPAQRQAAGAYWLNTFDPDYTGNPILDPTNALLAVPTGTNNRVAVTINPADYTLPAIFGNAYYDLGGWLPALAPLITVPPANQTANVGESETFQVVAIGIPVPTYQWLKAGTNIVGGTNATLTLTNVQLADAVAYSVIVSNSVASVTKSATLTVTSPNGFCMVNGTVSGGAGGTVVTVTNGTDFNTQINIAGPRIIQVSGIISIGRVFTTANKTIIGLGTNAMLFGNLNISNTTNVIVQNLRVSSPANDGLTIWNAQHVWVDHCTFYDCGDGCADQNRGSEYNTVSWCKFLYVKQVEHQFTMIMDGYPNTGVGTNYGWYTLHHNWWKTGSFERMPASSYGRIHMYNNYWNCTNNGYCSDARNETQFVSENNYYAGVNNPLYADVGSTGLIFATNNIYSGTTGTPSAPGTDTVSMYPLPYTYTLDPTANVPSIVTGGAGAAGPDTLPIPPKIWEGGGSGNNFSTAINWGLNETPKEDDTLVFAGGTRLTPNNDFSANTEFYNLMFSNNASAFVVGGNALNLGDSITDDSGAVQTFNVSMDFAFGQFHFPTNRTISVNSAAGSLIFNGNIAGDTNAYFNSYSITKQGPGLLMFNGTNTFIASLFLNGGLVKFSTLNTNLAGSLGTGTSITINGGGLQWVAGNTSDISTRTVTISTNGATFDVGGNTVTLTNRIGNDGVGSLTKLGSGTLIFNATNNYKGDTLIAQGTLALGLNGLLTNSPQIILSNNATLDVSGRSDGTQTLLVGKSLVGNGTIRGSVIAASGSTIAPGFSIGTLVITNALAFQSGSTNIMELNKSMSSCDLITGMVSVIYGGRLIVTNVNGTLSKGDSFKLFNAASYSGSFSSITLPALSGDLIWVNKLAIDGTIAVSLPVNTTPTNLVTTVVGNGLQINWPADHIGWRLEAQTNTANTGLNTNWTPVTGSDATNQMLFPLALGNGSVFFRLVYP